MTRCLKSIKSFLDDRVETYETEAFIPNDPISIPHLFKKRADIEISAFIAAILAWGNRKIILRKCHEILTKMDYAPHEFLMHASGSDLNKLSDFKHRTIKGSDLQAILLFLKGHYEVHESLETAFRKQGRGAEQGLESCLDNFHDYLAKSVNYNKRVLRHISSPRKGSACKRVSMFLRWMVRKNSRVDFGLWHRIDASELVCPLDLHVGRISRSMGLLVRKQNDWRACLELTEVLRTLNALDPARYDFALFGIGVEEKSAVLADL